MDAPAGCKPLDRKDALRIVAPGLSAYDLPGIALGGADRDAGRGLFATRAFAAGEEVFSERPLATLPPDAPPMERYLRFVDPSFSPTDRGLMLDMSMPDDEQLLLGAEDDPANPAAPHVAHARMSVEQAMRERPELAAAGAEVLLRVHLAWTFNAYALRTPGGEGGAPHAGMFTVGAKINHACAPWPNVEYSSAAGKAGAGAGAGAGGRWVALRDMAPGEELLVSYLDTSSPEQSALLSAHARRRVLLRTKGFLCLCPACTSLAGPDRQRGFPCPECCARVPVKPPGPLGLALHDLLAGIELEVAPGPGEAPTTPPAPPTPPAPVSAAMLGPGLAPPPLQPPPGGLHDASAPAAEERDGTDARTSSSARQLLDQMKTAQPPAQHAAAAADAAAAAAAAGGAGGARATLRGGVMVCDEGARWRGDAEPWRCEACGARRGALEQVLPGGAAVEEALEARVAQMKEMLQRRARAGDARALEQAQRSLDSALADCARTLGPAHYATQTAHMLVVHHRAARLQALAALATEGALGVDALLEVQPAADAMLGSLEALLRWLRRLGRETLGSGAVSAAAIALDTVVVVGGAWDAVVEGGRRYAVDRAVDLQRAARDLALLQRFLAAR